MTRRYGCWNTKREDGYYVKDGYIVKGPFVMQLAKYIKDTSSAECQYRKEVPKDDRCEGCQSP